MDILNILKYCKILKQKAILSSLNANNCLLKYQNPNNRECTTLKAYVWCLFSVYRVYIRRVFKQSSYQVKVAQYQKKLK